MRFDLRNLRFDNRRRVPNYVALSTGAVAASYLLDTYPAFAAYDVAFQLKADQVQMIEVREDGTGTFEWIAPSGGVLDESALLAHTGVNNGYVRTLKDAQNTAATYDASQATAGNQPQIVAAGVVLKDNGKPALTKVSTATYLTTPSFGDHAQPNTIFAVANLSGTAWQSAFDGRVTISSQRHLLEASTTGMVRIYAGTSLTETVSSGNTGAQKIYTCLFNTTSSICRSNTVQILSGNTGTALINGLTLCNYAYHTEACDTLQGVIFYNTDQTANFAAIETAINDLYGAYV